MATTERQKATKILIINDSSSLVNLPATTFRDNIRSFLADYAEIQDYSLERNNTIVSRLFLAGQATGVGFPLFVIEEQISGGSSSPNPLCDFCRCVGWSHHYVSKRKYHLIIPASDEWMKPLTKDSLEVTSRHLLHGVIHCNGFGHLLCINSDGVSSFLSGDQIMNLWDRLCSALHTRKISLDDTSRKRSMDLRLLHGVAYGRSWFGKWDYTLSHGNFGVRKDQYTRSILILSSMQLDKIMEDFSGTRKERLMKMIIGFYRESSQTPLVTLSELLQFMLAFRSKAPVERKTAIALAAISSSPVPGLDPYEDILYLYRNLLLTYPDTEVYSDASEVILNCKCFVKEWALPSHQGQEYITVCCQVLPNHEELLRDLTRKLPPGELVMVSQNATIRELKSAVEKALRDTYCVMESFEVLEIRNKYLVKIDENSGLESEGGEVRTEFVVTGFGLDTCTELRYEGGFDNWTVDCRCGTIDDDGERMVACDACKVWHHTKCHSIEDDEDVPSVFLCYRC